MAPATPTTSALPDLDATQWHGPWLLLKVKQFLTPLAPGQMAWVTTRDPAATPDLERLLGGTGFGLVRSQRERGTVRFLIRRLEAYPAPTNPSSTWEE